MGLPALTEATQRATLCRSSQALPARPSTAQLPGCRAGHKAKTPTAARPCSPAIAGLQHGPPRAVLRCSQRARRSVAARATLKAVVWDCDGVILESEDLHRRAYNAAFEHFDVRCNDLVVEWDEDFYDVLQNTIGGGKPKMRWFFGEHAQWPTSSVLGGRAPESDEERVQLIDTLQDWKSEKYQAMIASGEVAPRAGVLRLMDETRAAGLKLAVCSAATKSSVIATLNSLIGSTRFQSLDCFLAGDDAPRKKPDPIIYELAAERLGVKPEECVVIEDSTIGLEAALGAGMRCIITYTPSTRSQSFEGAERIVGSLGESPAEITVESLMQGAVVQDDRIEMVITSSGVTFTEA